MCRSHLSTSPGRKTFTDCDWQISGVRSAWERGVKSLYYLRSKSVQRASFAGAATAEVEIRIDGPRTDYEECLACQ